MMDICHSTFVQKHRIDNVKSELSCQLWSLGDYGMSVWVPLLATYVLPRGGIDNEGDCACAGGGAKCTSA